MAMDSDVTIKVQGDTDQAKQAIQGLVDTVSGLGESFAGLADPVALIGAALAAVTAVVAGTVAAVYELASNAADAGDSIQKMSDITGIAVENMGQLQFAVDAAGGNLEKLQMTLARMTMKEAADSSGKFSNALKDLGLNAAQFKGEDMEAKLLDLAKGFQNAGDKTNVMGDAIALLGPRGTALIPVLDKLTPDLMAMADGMAASWTPEQTKQAETFTVDMKVLGEYIEALGVRIGQVVLPYLSDMLDKFIHNKEAMADIAEAANVVAHTLGYLVAAIGDYVAQTVNWAGNFLNVIALMGDGLIKLMDKFAAASDLLAHFDPIYKGIGDGWRAMEKPLAADVADLESKYKSLVGAAQSIEDETGKMGKALQDLDLKLPPMTDHVKNHSAATDQLTKDQIAHQKAVEAMIQTLEGEGKQYEVQIDALTRLTQQDAVSANEEGVGADTKKRIIDMLDQMIAKHEQLTPWLQKYYDQNNQIGTKEQEWAQTLSALHQKTLDSFRTVLDDTLAAKLQNLEDQRNAEAQSFEKQFEQNKINEDQMRQAMDEIDARYDNLELQAKDKHQQDLAQKSVAGYQKLLQTSQSYYDKLSVMGEDAQQKQLDDIAIQRDAAETALNEIPRTAQNATLWDAAKQNMDAYFDHLTNKANNTYDTLEERLREQGVLTVDEANKQIDAAKLLYDQMAASGKYSYQQLEDAHKKWFDAAYPDWSKFIDVLKGIPQDFLNATLSGQSFGQAMTSIAKNILNSFLQMFSQILTKMILMKLAAGGSGGGISIPAGAGGMVTGGSGTDSGSTDLSGVDSPDAGFAQAADSSQPGLGSQLGNIGMSGGVGLAGTALTGAIIGNTAAMSTALIAGAATMGIGAAVVGAIALYKHLTASAGRDMVIEFAKNYGDINQLHTELVQKLGDDGEKLWEQLASVGKNNTQQAQTAIKNVQDALAAYDKQVAQTTQDEGNLISTLSQLGIKNTDVLKTNLDNLISLGGPSLKTAQDSISKLTAAVKDYQDQLGQRQSFQQVEQDAQSLGLTIDDMNDKFKQGAIEDSAGQIAQQWAELSPYVANVGVLADKYLDSIQKMVSEQETAGVKIPDSMKPIIQSLIDQGKLLDANGGKITDISTIDFEKDPLQASLDKLNDVMDSILQVFTDMAAPGGPLEKFAVQGKKAADTVTTAVEGIPTDVTVNIHSKGGIGGGSGDDSGLPGGAQTTPFDDSGVPAFPNRPWEAVTKSGLVSVHPGDVVGVPSGMGGIHFNGDFNVYPPTGMTQDEARRTARELARSFAREFSGMAARGEVVFPKAGVKTNVSAR